jgi:hypothetical protein
VLIIAAIIVVFVVVGIRQRRLAETEEDGDATDRGPRAPQLLFALVPVAIFAVVLVDALRLSFLGAVFPMLVAGAMLLLAVPVAARLSVAPASSSLFHDGEAKTSAADGRFWAYPAWVAGLVGLSGLAGFLIANTLFFLAFLRFAARCSWRSTLALTAVATLGLVAVAQVLVLDFPQGLLQNAIDLPWPLR